jgi:hypothetical protein
MQTRIICRWPLADELPVAAVPVALDDGEAWWAGTQRCFAGFVLASAAASLAHTGAIARTLATHTDERPTPPVAFVPSDDAPPLLQAFPGATTYVVWATDDDFALGPRALAEQDWQPPTPAAPAPVLRTWVDADVVPQVPTPLASEDYWHRLQWVPAEPQARVWQHQDEVTTQPAALTVDEAYWQQPFVVPPPAPEAARSADDEIVPQPLLEEDYWQQPYSVTVQPLAALWQQPDELPTPPTPLPFDEWGTWPFNLNLQPARMAPLWHDDVAFDVPPVVYTRAPSGNGYTPRTVRSRDRAQSTPTTRPTTGGGKSSR